MQEYTVKVYDNGSKSWFQNGQCHRVDGPAIEGADGSKYWYQNGKYHRVDGPAVEGYDGSKAWYQNGQRHRVDGPAVERADGHKEWYIEDKEYTEAEFNKKVNSKKVCNHTGNVVEIEGKKYKLVPA